MNQIHSLARNKCGSYFRRSKSNILPFQQWHFYNDTLRESGSFLVLMWTTNCDILKLHFFMNHFLSFTRNWCGSYFRRCKTNFRPFQRHYFYKNTQRESGSIFCLMWTTYCRDFEDFQLIFMNHIRLLIRNQCGSHIILGIPNPLAFQQNYSRYDGPSESGSFFTFSKPGLT